MLLRVRWGEWRQIARLDLDLSDPSGRPYKTVVLAGENGTGKTTILDTLSTFLNLDTIEPFELIEYEASGQHVTIRPSSEHPEYGWHDRSVEGSDNWDRITSNRNNQPGTIDADPFDLRGYGCVYSRARSGFSTEPIKSSTTQQLDDSKHIDDRDDDYTSIKQLLVDIEAQDSSDFFELGRKQGNVSYPDFEPSSRISRFRAAFNGFFDSLTFEGVDNNDPNEKRVVFRKHGVDVSIDDLSTGEKQVVFRGAQLLRNSGNLDGGVVLIDEPELSMHPKWQQKVLSFYEGLFSHGGSQLAQLVVATHSEYVVRSALERPDDVLVVVLGDTGLGVTARRVSAPYSLPTITAAETNYHAFGVASVDYHIQLYGALQGKIGVSSVKACDQYIENSPPYDPLRHRKPSLFKSCSYETLSTYIRNAIDHPDNGNTFTDGELETSINLLIDLL